MSLANIFLTESRALVAVDTQVRSALTGEIGEAAKMLLLPYPNAVLTIRGLNFILGSLALNSILHWPSTFDVLTKAIPQLLPQCLDILAANSMALLGKPAHEAEAFNQEVGLVGFSEKKGRMCAYVFITHGSKAVHVEEIEPMLTWAAPWSDAWGDVIEAETPALMRELAEVQVLRGKQLDSTAPLGGKLLLCELTKDEAKFSSLGALHSARSAEAEGEADASR